jgi:hypothetical protein
VPPLHTVRFTARYVSGYYVMRSIFYELDGGAPQFLGAVTQYADYYLSASFNQIRVYASSPLDSLYGELYVDGVRVACGMIGAEGLRWPGGSCP